MPRKCSVCSNPNRAEIDKALVAGNGYRTLTDRYGLSKTALIRHKTDHLPASIVKAHEAEEVLQADSLLDRLRTINRETADVLRDVRRIKDYDLWLKAIARAEKQIELEGRLLGELQAQQVVNVSVSPQWLTLRTAILTALTSHPAARDAVLTAITEADTDAGN
jgi:hypothetical protein